MKNKTLFVVSILLLASLLLSACGSITGGLSEQVFSLINKPANTTVLGKLPPTQAPKNVAPADPGLVAAYEDTLSKIYENVAPSVVNIRVVLSQTAPSLNEGGIPESPFGFPQDPNQGSQPLPQALGSGFVWDTEGHIITNNHVVDGADKIEVTFSDGTVLPADLVGRDPDSDLAVIKVDAPSGLLVPVSMGASKQVHVGELAIAIGNPFGLEGTMTVGIISAIGRSMPVGTMTGGPSYSIPDVIQTDAPINPGNSGGVLVNDQGEVIGVTFAIESPVGANAGIGFVIPSAIVQRVVPSLISTGKYEHPYLGISATPLNPDIAKAMGLKPQQHGALVEEVVPDGPADKAGLKGSSDQITIDGQNVNVGGDVIVAVDGQPIDGMDDLIAYLSNSTSVGQQIDLTILRNGKEEVVGVLLAARPNQLAEQPALPNQPPKNIPANAVWLGILGESLTPEIASQNNLDGNLQGVIIQQVVKDSPASKADLRNGDVITAINGETVTTIEALKGYLTNAHPGQEITLTVLRQGNEFPVSVTLESRPTQNP